MYPNSVQNGPASAGQYIPYFYQSGLYLRYGVSARSPGWPVVGSTYSTYDFSRDRPAFVPFDRVQTVEEVVQRGYFAIPNGDPVTAIISDKRHTSRFGLDDVIQQIRGRQQIYDLNIQELDESICAAHNTVFRQEADQGAPANQRQQYSAEKRVQEIYEQKRTERINLWRDVSRLRLELPEAAQRYLTAHRKVSALESTWGDGP
jgi:hypothetical protein